MFVGGGRRHDELVALAGSLGLAGRVTFTGVVHDRDRIVALLDSASVFARAVPHGGAAPRVQEAMARALPAGRLGGGRDPELLDPGRLAPAGDDVALAAALADLLCDEAA